MSVTYISEIQDKSISSSWSGVPWRLVQRLLQRLFALLDVTADHHHA